MIETSRYLSSRHAVTGAARNIARMAAVTDISDSDLLDAAKTFLDLSSFRSDSTEVEVSFSPSNVPGMRLVTAEVRLDFSDVSLVGDPFNFNATKVRGFSTLLTQESP